MAVVATLVCVGVGLGARVLSETRPPTTHADAVAMTLAADSIAVQAVVIEQIWPSALPFYAYGDDVMPYQARIIVTTAAGARHAGVLTCLAAPHDCVMTIPSLAVLTRAVPDVESSARWYTTWWDWLTRHMTS